jgi:hypothetical protein
LLSSIAKCEELEELELSLGEIGDACTDDLIKILRLESVKQFYLRSSKFSTESLERIAECLEKRNTRLKKLVLTDRFLTSDERTLRAIRRLKMECNNVELVHYLYKTELSVAHFYYPSN